jgi:hypothetical protein
MNDARSIFLGVKFLEKKIPDFSWDFNLLASFMKFANK